MKNDGGDSCLYDSSSDSRRVACRLIRNGRVGRRKPEQPRTLPNGTTTTNGVWSGPAISDGRLFWGSGYSLFGTPNNRLYSFGLPD
jgi:hypothetical protein